MLKSNSLNQPNIINYEKNLLHFLSDRKPISNLLRALEIEFKRIRSYRLILPGIRGRSGLLRYFQLGVL
ncbi:hypothetical protein DBR11_09040 [Pedobacter sp. HMWF019]|nr:hypothetical protein DBR11_09040 [Pedobacter sp. HMWF019]